MRKLIISSMLMCSLFLFLQPTLSQKRESKPSSSVKNVSDEVRSKLNLNRDWKFIMEDVEGAQSSSFSDDTWSKVNIPHSFSLPYFMWKSVYQGYGWYRKTINVPSDWLDKSVSIEFEGSFIETEVFVNGTLVGKHVGGYTGFSFDISNKLQAGDNVIAVRVNNLWKPNVAPRAGDHQFSGGIYRDVYLNVTDKLAVDWFGTFFSTPLVSGETAVIKASTEVKNNYSEEKQCQVTTEVFSPEGEKVTSVVSDLVVPAGKVQLLTHSLPSISNPKLWHPSTPHLYKGVTKISINGSTVDRYETTFGIRFTKWTAENGFWLNGERYYLLGANVHQDRAGWGDATTNAGFFRDVKQMKDCGFNTIRGSHYPHDPAFVKACDELGVVFFSENAFWGMGGSLGDNGWGTPSSGAYPTVAEHQDDFDNSVLQQLKSMIRIHRNSPSIMAWSMSNEPFFTDQVTKPRMKTLLSRATDSTKLWDPTRFVAIGGCQRDNLDKLGQGQVAFYNGDGAGVRNPGVPNMVSEYSSRSAQRPGDFSPGWGELNKDNGIDNPYFDWRGGQVIWCGIDHGTVGGTGLATMGLVDYFRLPKRQYFWYQECYANGVKEPIAPQWPTSGTPKKLSIKADKSIITSADGTDDVMLTISVLDASGKEITNNVPVTLTIVSGPGEFPTGTSIKFLPPDNSNEQADIFIREGQCAIDFRSYYAGTSVIEATSPGLEKATISITIQGEPQWIEGVTPTVEERPYRRYRANMPPQSVTDMLLAKDRPCSVSSTFNEEVNNKSNANDSDPASFWKPLTSDSEKWWKLDMEATYSLNRISILFPSKSIYKYIIEVSPNGDDWQKVIDQSDNTKSVNSRMHYGNLGRDVRFVRVTFNSILAGIAEIKIGGSSNLPENPNLLTGTVIGVDGSWDNNPSLTKEAAFDFDVETFFDAPSGASGFWVGLDLGKDANYFVDQVKFWPRSGLAARMKNGVFEISNNIEFTSPKLLYTIVEDPNGKENLVDFSSEESGRYVRYRSTPSGNGNIAELEFYGRSVLSSVEDKKKDNSLIRVYYDDQKNSVSIHFISDNKSNNSLTIFNADGKKLKEINLVDDSFNLSSLGFPSGIYVIAAKASNVSETIKVAL